MAAGVYNFKVEQGVPYSFTVAYKDKDDNPINLTGFTAEGKMKQKMSDTLYLAQFDCTIDYVTSTITIKLKHDALNGVMFKSNKHDDYVEAVYDIILKKGSGESLEVIRLLNGTIQISPRVT